MITLIEALNFRSLHYVRQPVGPFQVLVGPNASGKTAFLDVVAFLSSLVQRGLEGAIAERTQNFQDLVWGRPATGGRFELAIEVEIPTELRPAASHNAPAYDTMRYEVAIGIDKCIERTSILAENVLLLHASINEEEPSDVFPRDYIESPETILFRQITNSRSILRRTGLSFSIFSESYLEPKEYHQTFVNAPKIATLLIANTLIGEFPNRATAWLWDLLSNIHLIAIENTELQNGTRPNELVAIQREMQQSLKRDDFSLPQMVARLQRETYREWLAHIRIFLPEIQNIEVAESGDNLNLIYEGDLTLPLHLVSTGTLRLLTLTILAYVPDDSSTYLIEKPEEDIYPQAIEAVFQSLSSMYDSQVLLITHSPTLVSLVNINNLLCFAKNKRQETDVVSGKKHPFLRKWLGGTNIGLIFAAGVLD